MASGPITSRHIGGEKMKTVADFIFLGSKITADGDYSHEIKRHLPLGRKAVTNLDSVLKSRDITWMTMVCTVKARIFPVVVYRYESWMLKKAERRRTDAFKLWSWIRLLRIPWTARISNQSILKEINHKYLLEGLMLKLQYFDHLMQRADSLEKPLMLGKIEGKRRGWQRMKVVNRGWQKMTEVGWHHQLNGHEFEQTLGDTEGQGSLAWCSPWLNNNNKLRSRTRWFTGEFYWTF